ncbi:chitinase-3-like protein 1 [Epargyreus clarus]|uniref:chitinase-3-like protein 1 n=1 Tax=Epargyreus clarus TaxID=520877 RepID=UPI003C2EA5AA
MILSLFLFAFSLSYVSSHNIAPPEEKIVFCYYGTWATYRQGLGKFDVDHIDSNLCTHLVYTFVGIDNRGTVISLDPWLDLPDNWGRNNFGKFNALKQQNPKLKTILAVGGWNEGSAKYSIMAASPQLRKNFVDSALDMVITHGFDGFDVDWEYPNRRDTVHGKADVDNFTQLLKELKEAFEPHGLLVTAAVGAVEDMASQSYDIPGISKYLDFINIMTYDMYGSWDPVTGHNAPLHKGEGDEHAPAESLYTVDYALKYWLDEGCPPEKLVLGVPLYGRSFTLRNANVNGVRAPAGGEGIAGPYTATRGFIGYNEFCYKLLTEKWDVRFDHLARVPYAVQGTNWVSYDNPKSVVEKLEYASKYNLAGVMVWSIETDDFHGICDGESFPLLKALNRAIGNSIPPSDTTSSTAAPTSSSSTTIASSSTTEAGSSTTAADSSTTPAGSSTTSIISPSPADPSLFLKMVTLALLTSLLSW